MKITKSQLKQIIKEEIEKPLQESQWQQNIDDYEEERGIGRFASTEEGMESFVAKQFVEPAQYRMSMPAFNLALEKFEVEFNLDFPESIAKLHSILEEMGHSDLANGLRHIYGDDVDYGKDY